MTPGVPFSIAYRRCPSVPKFVSNVESVMMENSVGIDLSILTVLFGVGTP
jgi:hypothetical protein